MQIPNSRPALAALVIAAAVTLPAPAIAQTQASALSAISAFPIASVVLATLGADGADYLARLQSWGATTEHVRVIEDSYTAQAIIITDADNNQITAFHPGAMQHAHVTPVPDRADLRIAIVAPDGRDAMMQHAEQLARAGVPFIFDPGQGLPMFDGAELSEFLRAATWLAVNDYEARMLCDRVGQSLADLSRGGLRGIVVTLGEAGCELWQAGASMRLPGVPAGDIVDPTGCGDAFRAGLLYGLERAWAFDHCASLGNRLGSIKIASQGGQNHAVSADPVAPRR